MGKYVLHLVMLLLVADVGLALSGYGFAIDSAVVQPGQNYGVPELGNLGAQKTPTLACRYWRGIGSNYAIFEYGAKGEARTACPVFVKRYGR